MKANEVTIIDSVEKPSYWREDINKLQKIIQDTLKDCWLVYKAWKQERGRIKNFYDKTFRQFVDEYMNWVSTEKAVAYLIKWAYDIKFWADINSWESLYKYYASIYNAIKKGYDKVEWSVIDLSYWTTHFVFPKDWEKYLQINVNDVNKWTFWIMENDEDKLFYAKENKKLIKALWGGTFHPWFVTSTNKYYKPSIITLPEPKKDMSDKAVKKRKAMIEKMKEERVKARKQLQEELTEFKPTWKYDHISEIDPERESEILNKLKT